MVMSIPLRNSQMEAVHFQSGVQIHSAGITATKYSITSMQKVYFPSGYALLSGIEQSIGRASCSLISRTVLVVVLGSKIGRHLFRRLDLVAI
jgi:hypothetical protein